MVLRDNIKISDSEFFFGTSYKKLIIDTVILFKMADAAGHAGEASALFDFNAVFRGDIGDILAKVDTNLASDVIDEMIETYDMSTLLDIRIKMFRYGKKKLLESVSGPENVDIDPVLGENVVHGCVDDAQRIMDNWSLIARKGKPRVAMDTLDLLSYVSGECPYFPYKIIKKNPKKGKNGRNAKRNGQYGKKQPLIPFTPTNVPKHITRNTEGDESNASDAPNSEMENDENDSNSDMSEEESSDASENGVGSGCDAVNGPKQTILSSAVGPPPPPTPTQEVVHAIRPPSPPLPTHDVIHAIRPPTDTAYPEAQGACVSDVADENNPSNAPEHVTTSNQTERQSIPEGRSCGSGDINSRSGLNHVITVGIAEQTITPEGRSSVTREAPIRSGEPSVRSNHSVPCSSASDTSTPLTRNVLQKPTSQITMTTQTNGTFGDHPYRPGRTSSPRRDRVVRAVANIMSVFS